MRQFEVLYTDLLDDENVHGVVLNSRDVSERKAFEEQLAHQAFHDPVTNLANRALFVERVRHAVPRARRERSRLAVIFMDLDDFKTINDSLGHAAGDAVLLEIAKRLDASIRPSDTAARFGGDEFAVLLEDVGSAQDAADTAERILESLSAPLRLEGKELFVRCSLGISIAEGATAAGADELIRNADAAMYIAKRDGKGGYRLFEPAMHEGVLERLELRADLQRAMTAGQLELYYQPLVHLSDGGATGVEALLRWHHPERGMLGPDTFIPLAEEMGLIVPIGRWVLREACRQARQMQTLLPADPPLSMSVNLSVKQLQHSDIAADVRDALAESGLAAGSLTLEITETVLMTDTDLAVQRLEELKSARRPARDGRLRHRLLVAELPQPLPGRHPQDGPLVPNRRRVTDGLGARVRRHRARRDAAARDRRRRDRVPRTMARAARARLRLRPRLPVRPAHGRRHHAEVPARRRAGRPEPSQADAP